MAKALNGHHDWSLMMDVPPVIIPTSSSSGGISVSVGISSMAIPECTASLMRLLSANNCASSKDGQAQSNKGLMKTSSLSTTFGKLTSKRSELLKILLRSLFENASSLSGVECGRSCLFWTNSGMNGLGEGWAGKASLWAPRIQRGSKQRPDDSTRPNACTGQSFN